LRTAAGIIVVLPIAEISGRRVVDRRSVIRCWRRRRRRRDVEPAVFVATAVVIARLAIDWASRVIAPVIIIVVAVTLPAAAGEFFLLLPVPLLGLAALFPDFFGALPLLFTELSFRFPAFLLLLESLLLPLVAAPASSARVVVPVVGKQRWRENERGH
jgi:hypothetical protein